MMRRYAPVTVGILVAAGLAIVVTACNKTVVATTSAQSAPAVPIVTAVYDTYTDYVQLQGRVGASAESEARLAFGEPGVIKTIDVAVGDHVTAGAALAELDPGGLAIDLAQARADAGAASAAYAGGTVADRARFGATARVAAARARLSSVLHAKVDVDSRALEREQALYAGGVAAAKDVDAARAQLTTDQSDVISARADIAQAESDLRAAQAQGPVASAQLASAREKVAAAERNLGNAVLRAPVDGVVTGILKHAGEVADPSQTLLTLGPPSSETITLTATNADARKIRAGDSVTLTTASAGTSGKGLVRAVVPSVDPATQTNTVVVAGAPPGAVPGDAVEATISVGTRRGVVIPTAAIVEDPQTGKSIVFVSMRSKTGETSFAARTITVGAGDAQRSLISHGLRAGERIAGEGAYDLLAPAGG
jgi:multidrug efflux pump subunit AcrA (membrane-fusion protein)